MCSAALCFTGWLSTGKHPHDVIVSGSSDCSIKVWHLSDRRCLCTLRGHNSGVTCVAVEGDIVLSGSLDNSTRIWDISKVFMLVFQICVTTILGLLRKKLEYSGCASFWGDAYTVRKWMRNLCTKIRKCIPTKRKRETNDASVKHLYHRVHQMIQQKKRLFSK